jgi:hypothetical protein
MGLDINIAELEKKAELAAKKANSPRKAQLPHKIKHGRFPPYAHRHLPGES